LVVNPLRGVREMSILDRVERAYIVLCTTVKLADRSENLNSDRFEDTIFELEKVYSNLLAKLCADDRALWDDYKYKVRIN